jgi:formylglycine-generating enzyme required for sulfatase activity
MDSIDIDWVEIPAGPFILGLSQEQEENLLSQLPQELIESGRLRILQQDLSREVPERRVTLPTFYISRFPITNQQYLAFAKGGHRYATGNIFTEPKRTIALESDQRRARTMANHPATTNWHQAQTFCEWIGARLPTSAEWEKAARGTDGRLYPWGDIWDAQRGNFMKTRQRVTSPVHAYPSGRSPYGVMDMMGNTYEWTMSTMFGIGMDSGKTPTELVVCRSCGADFDLVVDNPGNPDWFRNRITKILLDEMNFGGLDLVGFRPVLDTWQKRAWAGF